MLPGGHIGNHLRCSEAETICPVGDPRCVSGGRGIRLVLSGQARRREPRSSFLSSPSLLEGSVRFTHRRGRAYRIAGIVLLLVAALIGETMRKQGSRDAVLSVLPLDGEAWVWVLALSTVTVVAPLLGIRAFALARRGRQMGAVRVSKSREASPSVPFSFLDPDGNEVGSIEPSGAVLYLRPFEEDAAAAESSGRGRYGSLATEEEHLAWALKPAGPLVAIGRPGEKLPELGAFRMYVGDEEWQDVVTHWLTRSRLVVLRTGVESAGFLWEVMHAPRLTAPQKLVLLVAQDGGVYAGFRRRVEHLFPRGLPDYPRKAVDRLRRRGPIGLVYFQPDWTPRFSWIPPPFLTLGGLNYVLSHTFAPVFKQLGVEIGFYRRAMGRLAIPFVPSPLGEMPTARGA